MKILLFQLLIMSCTINNTSDNNVYTVNTNSDKKPPLSKLSKAIPPLPPHGYYPGFNFLVDSLGNLFYFQTDIDHLICEGVRGLENSLPDFIDLRPNNIIEVPLTGLHEFVLLNILKLDPSYRNIAIGLQKDSVRSVTLSKLMNILNDPKNRIAWYFRFITEEENLVLIYKKENKYYDPEDILWDSSKTIFPPKQIEPPQAKSYE